MIYDIFKRASELHREDGPAYQRYLNDGSGVVYIEKYFINGKLNREDGPAIIHRQFNGNIALEEYYIDGKEHREDGPAIIYYNDGVITHKAYYNNGIRINNNDNT